MKVEIFLQNGDYNAYECDEVEWNDSAKEFTVMQHHKDAKTHKTKTEIIIKLSLKGPDYYRMIFVDDRIIYDSRLED